MLQNIFKKLSSNNKTLILVLCDLIVINASIYFSYWLRSPELFSNYLSESDWIFPAFSFLGIFIYIKTGYYRGLLNYAGSSYIYKSIITNLLVVLSAISFGTILQLDMPPRSIWIITYILIFGSNGLIRIFLRDLARSISQSKRQKSRVVIYGAGAAGAQLISSIKTFGNYKIIFVIDDNNELWNRDINGIKIYSPKKLNEKKLDIDYVLFAIPSLPLYKRKQIIYKIQKQGIPILQVPSLDEITKGKAKLENLKPVEIEDLLERDIVAPIEELLRQEINNSIILITGAGGSIGSEISLQICKIKVKKVILFDSSERSLYEITNSLKKFKSENIEVVSILGDCCDEKLIKKIVSENKVQIVFHASAYKHVNIVEENPIQGLYNNIVSSYVICKVSASLKVKKVILISSDKAVRPTNIMGASKRVSELIFQAYAKAFKSTCYTMVRFGNVLNSSGSVVPLFKEQIKNGGPITITHPDVIRYFMTIKEASQLVIQASALAEGGEVFLLDMGEPIKIIDLAKQMVKLSGLTFKNKNNKNGDIEIVFTGLRSGEKLYEELLIDNKSKITSHPLIYKAEENFIEYPSLIPLVDSLIDSLKKHKLEISLKRLELIVPEWKNSFKDYDL